VVAPYVASILALCIRISNSDLAQARELTRLRNHFTLIRDCYRRLTAEFVTQLQHVDSAVSTVVQEPAEPADSPTHPKEKQDAPRD
jgi:hypothetical protein